MPMTTSTSAAGANVVMVQLEVTTSTEVGVTIAPRIAVHHLSHRALESSARPFETPSFRSDFAPHRLSPSTTMRPNPNFGSLTSAWLVSWAAPPTTESSSDNSPCSYRTPLEHGSRISHLDRSMTGMIW
jgi:hypothetical protein